MATAKDSLVHAKEGLKSTIDCACCIVRANHRSARLQRGWVLLDLRR